MVKYEMVVVGIHVVFCIGGIMVMYEMVMVGIHVVFYIGGNGNV